jgi:uncharacterized protein (PEP-CTERM system associated)
MVTAMAMVTAMGTDRRRSPQRDAVTGIGIERARLVRTDRYHLGNAAAATACAALWLLATCCACAQTTHIVASVGVLETFTNNVNLSPSGSAESDLVSQITPALSINEKGAHSSLQGFISVPILLYARTGSENNTAYPTGSLTGSIEAIDKFFFIEASATASQQFLNPFGQTPVSLANATDNRYTSVAYRVSPYIQGVTVGNVTYLLRYNALWGNLSSTPIAVNSNFYSEWIGTLESPVAPYGWGVDLDRTEVKFNDQRPQITQLVRFRLRYQLEPQFQVSGSVGYEDNQYPLADYADAIYGVGLTWRPNEVTNLLATWEHRFFGASYLATFDHRTPLSSWNLRASRNITSYPQQLGALPAGGNVPGLLNDLLSTRYPDPAQRQTVVDQLIQQQGLPQVLGSPVNIYTQQILLQQYASASFGLLGVNNSIFFTAYNVMSEPISGSGNALPPALDFGNNNTQRGVDVAWNHAISGYTSLNASAGTSQTFSVVGCSLETRGAYVRIGFTTTLGLHTTGFAGARYQNERSDFAGSSYNEAAVFAGINYVFQ